MKVIKNENVILRDIHSVYFLINANEKYYENNRSIVKVNDTGKLIWELLDKSSDFDEIVDLVMKIYEISTTDAEMVREDVKMFLSHLNEVRYVQYE